MANAVALILKIDADDFEIKGESEVHSLDREDTIECLSFDQSATKHMDGKNPRFQIHNNAIFNPIRITKRIDCATPYIAKAFFKHEKVSGEFRFFRPSASSDGTTEQFFIMKIGNAYVVEHQIVSPNTLDRGSANAPPIEKVGIAYRDVSWDYTQGGIEVNLIF